MKELAILFRLLQLYSHNCHNLVARTVFFSDHAFLGELYDGYTDDYDDIIERIIGLYGADNISLNEIQMAAVQRLITFPDKFSENSQCFNKITELEKELCAKIEVICKTPGVTQGTIQLVGNQADKSESRQYKLRQRLAK